mmetsp:Transcript_98284/g.174998  ORF Transcript_98284/g.174998 Transcript_98284/m.174998 type:complete len:231 (+) Transcript_98284:63-755(+)|eukprot:CAMPEP_0197664050 /NCGR_PEP_ID=MMETSP1338-20131121/58401_1 /TAXON_ID=43686 ORGANISM="Pelagodinium beii, Strain RCC1491" /NCGR_SAMPLE_ID=MMETSP1338 /ASSEMBLY_ACC=CAM_ASM_000754 /LENGTH=230 /DNA_ID=CAMNT_0043242611 /DNA_START=46 /DNA_END=738 /DNA_ORIENTATION=+
MPPETLLHLQPFTESLATLQRSIDALEPHAEDWRIVEASLRSLLAHVVSKCEEAEHREEDGRATPPLAEPRESKVAGSPEPDALDEWYSDPWASPGQRLSPSPAKASPARSSPARSPNSHREEVATFSLDNQQDDAQTEVLESSGHPVAHGEVAPLEDVADPLPDARPTEPQWQYGRCVALKLVVHSPQGGSAFEQLLPVLLTVFQLSDGERKEAFKQRRKVQGNSWWPF